MDLLVSSVANTRTSEYNLKVPQFEQRIIQRDVLHSRDKSSCVLKSKWERSLFFLILLQERHGVSVPWLLTKRRLAAMNNGWQKCRSCERTLTSRNDGLQQDLQTRSWPTSPIRCRSCFTREQCDWEWRYTNTHAASNENWWRAQRNIFCLKEKTNTLWRVVVLFFRFSFVGDSLGQEASKSLLFC